LTKIKTVADPTAWASTTPPQNLFLENVKNLVAPPPTFASTCPESARGFQDEQPVPRQLCIGKTQNGRTAPIFKSFVCYEVTSCAESAKPSNIPIPGNAGIDVDNFVPSSSGSTTYDGVQGDWQDIGRLFPKASNCQAGDPLLPTPVYFPDFPIALECSTDICPVPQPNPGPSNPPPSTSPGEAD